MYLATHSMAANQMILALHEYTGACPCEGFDEIASPLSIGRDDVTAWQRLGGSHRDVGRERSFRRSGSPGVCFGRANGLAGADDEVAPTRGSDFMVASIDDPEDAPASPTSNFPARDLPQLSDAQVQNEWEGQVAPNVPFYWLTGAVKDQYVEVRIFFGSRADVTGVPPRVEGQAVAACAMLNEWLSTSGQDS
jgi:hypothetical protein